MIFRPGFLASEKLRRQLFLSPLSSFSLNAAEPTQLDGNGNAC